MANYSRRRPRRSKRTFLPFVLWLVGVGLVGVGLVGYATLRPDNETGSGRRAGRG